MNSYFLQYITIFRQMGRGCVFWFLNVALHIFMHVNKHQNKHQNKDQKKRKKLELLEVF